MSPDDLTSEQLEKGGQVAAAAVQAGEAEPDPQKRREAVKSAARREAEKVQIELSDEDCEKLAAVIITQLDQRGAFEPPPEPVQAPPPEQPTPGTVQTPPEAQQPRKQSFAERFRTR